MIDDNDIHRLDEIYVRKDDCQDIQCAVEKRAAPVKGAVLSYISIFPLIKSGSIASLNSAKY